MGQFFNKNFLNNNNFDFFLKKKLKMVFEKYFE